MLGYSQMLFYASLFLFCVVFSAIVLWLYRSMAEVGKAVYRAFLPSSKDKVTREVRQESLNTPLSGTAAPWGWSRNSSARRAAPKRSPVTKSVFEGGEYNVTRKPTVKKVKSGKNSKPWGW